MKKHTILSCNSMLREKSETVFELKYHQYLILIIVMYALDIAFRFRQQKFSVAEGFQLLKLALTAQ